MDWQQNSIQNDLNIPSFSKNKADIMETLAEKLLNVLDLEVLDFEKSPVKSLRINQVRSENNLLKFKKPLEITITKDIDTFNVSQTDLSIEVFDFSFRMAMKKFQEEVFKQYQENKEKVYFFKQYT